MWCVGIMRFLLLLFQPGPAEEPLILMLASSASARTSGLTDQQLHRQPVAHPPGLDRLLGIHAGRAHRK